MPPVVIDVRNAEDHRDVVHRAVQALVEGQLVAFPTETVYGVAASALDAEAVTRLVALKRRRPGHALTLAIRSADEARDYVPDMAPLAQRLARRCWPGPITLVVDDTHPESLVRRLPGEVQHVISPRKTVGLRVPGHQVVLDVLRMLAGPLVLSSANRTGEPEAVDAQGVIASLGEQVDLILDDGPCRFGQPSSVVRVRGDRYEILRPGVVPEQTLKRLSSMMLLLVCTGNTCRSPMAETLCRDMLAKRLGCSIDELEDRGFIVMSAGIAAMVGGRASPESVETMSRVGLALSGHETQPLTELLVRQADVIYTMTRSHREAIVAQWPAAAERTQLLCGDGSDIPDPIGGPLQRYQSCASQIQSALESRLDESGL
ncbi:MAG: threonylcarbamoyl-AMP synthase [Planctomycetes bacterium RBG_13_63_9]|nr:MAG: threonylcarbamoyl-AMP synthase [Planctomycetes bacterium RBG_13_63_9]